MKGCKVEKEGRGKRGLVMVKRLIFLILLTLVFISSAYSKEVSFTQEDRDRLRNVELKVERLEEGQKALNQRIDDLRGEVRDMKTFMLWGFGILFGGMGILIGLVMWDRRTVLSPAVKRIKEIEENDERVKRVLKELATKDPNIAEALKHVGLL